MITINNVSAEEFKISQENFSSSNFLQSAEMASLQLTRKNFLDTELLLIKNNDTIIGQAIINYKLKRKIFKEAIIVQGPVFNYQNLFEVEQAFKSLLNYLSKKGIYKLTVQPYVFPRKQYTRLKTTLENLGFQNKYNPENMEFGFSQIFLKNITQIKNEQELFNSFSGNIQRDIKKFTEMGVIVDELKYKNLNIFYNILKKTSERKQFTIQDFDFFKQIYKNFNQKAKFLIAYIDIPTYKNYLLKNITSLSLKIEEYENKPRSKKNSGHIKNYTEQLQSFIKRKKYIEDKIIDSEQIIISSYLFFDFSNEIVSYMGGNLAEFISFGGATQINNFMLKYALSNSKNFFNFGGTIETDMASKGVGNYKYKKQFGGELLQSLGSFEYLFPTHKTLKSIFLNIITQIKNKY